MGYPGESAATLTNLSIHPSNRSGVVKAGFNKPQPTSEQHLKYIAKSLPHFQNPSSSFNCLVALLFFAIDIKSSPFLSLTYHPTLKKWLPRSLRKLSLGCHRSKFCSQTNILSQILAPVHPVTLVVLPLTQSYPLTPNTISLSSFAILRKPSI